MLTTNYDAYAMSVVGKAADLFGIMPREMLLAGRNRSRAWPRMAAAWALREADPDKHRPGPGQKVFSLPRLCKIFPWDDHTTAFHALRRVEEIRANDPTFRARTDQLLAFAKEQRPAPGGE